MGTTYPQERAESLFDAGVPTYEPSPLQHPPYSVLDAAGGWWQQRRVYWHSFGVSDVGERPSVFNRGAPEASEASGNTEAVAQTSEFSPVLTELLVAYYSEPGDLIFDPFAGGPVRGLVAAHMGRKYYGLDVRAEQVAANIDADHPREALWRRGDARFDRPFARAQCAITCPPYHSLERYSDQPNDLSTMGWDEFTEAHGHAIANAADCTDGPLVWVVGDFRGPDGGLRGFPDLVAAQMEDAGLTVWNRHIVRHPLVTAPMRWRQQWESSRKMTMAHAEVVVASLPVSGEPGKEKP